MPHQRHHQACMRYAVRHHPFIPHLFPSPFHPRHSAWNALTLFDFPGHSLYKPPPDRSYPLTPLVLLLSLSRPLCSPSPPPSSLSPHWPLPKTRPYVLFNIFSSPLHLNPAADLSFILLRSKFKSARKPPRLAVSSNSYPTRSTPLSAPLSPSTSPATLAITPLPSLA